MRFRDENASQKSFTNNSSNTFLDQFLPQNSKFQVPDHESQPKIFYKRSKLKKMKNFFIPTGVAQKVSEKRLFDQNFSEVSHYEQLNGVGLEDWIPVEQKFNFWNFKFQKVQ